MLLDLSNGRAQFCHGAEGPTHAWYLRLGRPLTHRSTYEPEHEHRAQQTDEHPPPYGVLIHTVLLCLAIEVYSTRALCRRSPDLSHRQHVRLHDRSHIGTKQSILQGVALTGVWDGSQGGKLGRRCTHGIEQVGGAGSVGSTTPPTDHRRFPSGRSRGLSTLAFSRALLTLLGVVPAMGDGAFSVPSRRGTQVWRGLLAEPAKFEAEQPTKSTD